MPRTSAGLLPYRTVEGGLEVFVAHMGGPFWARKDAGAWSLVKGEAEPGEDDLAAVAAREFREETGSAAPGPPWTDLGEVRQSSSKVVRAWAVHAPDVAFVSSNEIEVEWPRQSGRTVRFPEVDRAEWMPVDDARGRLVRAQVAFLDRLADIHQGPTGV